MTAETTSIEERKAVLKRFRELLVQQRDRFRNYLNVLDKQQTIIGSGSTDDLLAYVELEENIVADIFSIQKVINPLEMMYNASAPYPADDIAALKITLENLKNETAVQAKCNRELISSRMDSIRSEIKVLRNNPFTASFAYKTANTASMIDIRG